MYGDDLEEESRQRKERIARLVSKLRDPPPPEKQPISNTASAPSSSSSSRTQPPPTARPGARGNAPVTSATTTATAKRLVRATTAERAAEKQQQQQQQQEEEEQQRRQKQKKQVAAEQSAKERVSSALLQQQMEERAKLRREKAALLQREAESRVKKRSQDEKLRHDEIVHKEEEQLLTYQQEYKRQLALKKEGSQQKDVLEMKELRAKAESFYKRQLLVRCGLAPLLRLIEIARNNWITAMDFFDDSLLQGAWVALYGFCATQKRDRLRREYRQASLATSHYKKQLIYSTFRRWLLHRRMLRAKATAVTGHFSRFTTNRRAWRAWRDALERSRRLQATKLRQAKPLGDRCLLRHCFVKWSAFMSERLLEVEVEARSDFTWSKVQSWLKE